MNFLEIFFVLVCGLGAINSFLFATYLFFLKKADRNLNKLFSILIISFSLRVAKTVWVFFFESIHTFYDIIWYYSFAMLPVLFFIYVAKMTDHWQKILNKFFLSISIVFMILVSIFVYQYEMMLFSVIMVLFFISLISGIIMITRFHCNKNSSKKSWLVTLTIFIGLIFVNYFLIPFVKFKFFWVEAFLFTIFIYYLTYLEIGKNFFRIIHKSQKLITTEDNKIIESINKLMEETELYLDPSISLAKMASELRTTSHDLSRILNEYFGLNFNNFINKYRIEEIKKQLRKPEYLNIKISEIAYQYGFNSISVFNSAFKKFTDQTPSQYQSQINN